MARPGQEPHPQPQLQVGNAGIGKLRGEREASVVQIHDPRQGVAQGGVISRRLEDIISPVHEAEEILQLLAAEAGAVIVVFGDHGQIEGRQVAESQQVTGGVFFHLADRTVGVQDPFPAVPGVGVLAVDLEIGGDVPGKIDAVPIRPAPPGQENQIIYFIIS